MCKALKGEAIVNYCKSLITQQMKASGSPLGVKIDEKKNIIRFTIWVKCMML
jgi:hypothetical protein